MANIADRTMTRTEYHQQMSDYRKHRYKNWGWWGSHEVMLHVCECREWASTKRCPLEFQYLPASGEWTLRQMERLGDYGGSLWEAELERRVSLYHLGYE